MSHQIFKPQLATAFCLALLLIFHASVGLGIDKYFQSRQISNRSGQTKKAISMNEMQRISDRLRKTLSVSQRQNAQTSALRQAMQCKKPYVFSRNSPDRLKGNDEFKVYMNDNNSTPTFITVNEKREGLSKQAAPLAARAVAIEFVKENASLFRLENPEAELQVTGEVSDALGKTHVKFNQYYNGIPVWGHDMVAHLTRHHQVYALNARYAPTPKLIDANQFVISSPSAVQIAQTDLQNTTKIEDLPDGIKTLCKYPNPQVKKYIWIEDKSQQPHLVWHIQIRPNIRDNWYYFVDANNGTILEKYNTTRFNGPATAQAKDLNGVTRTIHSYLMNNKHYMIDASRPIWKIDQTDILDDPRGALLTLDVRNHDMAQNVILSIVTSENNVWTDPVSVSAHSNMGIVFEYFYTVHGRRAIDNQGSTIMSIIHVTKSGQPMDDACWNGAFLVYGDGNVACKPLAGGLDVSTHEMTHGVTQYSVGLAYKFQSGALDESLSDVFGVMVDRDDWRIGEDIAKTNYYRSGALRDLRDPHNGGVTAMDHGWQPAHMNEYVELGISDDNGGVHINSGIPNRACYLIGSSIGKEKTEKIYYRILEAGYLNTQSNFVDMRLAAVQAAKDLYGENTPEVNAVNAAFEAVGIKESGGSKPDPDVPAIIGEEWIATVDWSSQALLLVKPVIQDPVYDIKLVTETPVSMETGNPISIADDGALIIFVDDDHNLRSIRSDGSGETVESSDGVWRSIALSPNGKMLAATTTLVDSSIYIFDLSGNDEHKKIHLYSPTTQENTRNYTTIFADAIDWNLTSEFLIFDAFTRIPQATGGYLEYWNINMLDPAEEIIMMLFPPQPEGVSIANPSFGQTSDLHIVFDYFDVNQGIYQIRAANLFTGDVFLLENNYKSFGYPRYSPDDRKVVFQRLQWSGMSDIPTLRQIKLKESKTEPAGTSIKIVSEGMLPNWFAIGSRSTDIKAPGEAKPREFTLAQNYPNPFNPKTVIEYRLPLNGKVKLTVYDILGKEVAVLAQGEQLAGNHQVVFNGLEFASGIYLYRLETNNAVETRRMILVK